MRYVKSKQKTFKPHKLFFFAEKVIKCKFHGKVNQSTTEVRKTLRRNCLSVRSKLPYYLPKTFSTEKTKT